MDTTQNAEEMACPQYENTPSLPLGAQCRNHEHHDNQQDDLHGGNHSGDHEEQDHFQQVCRSYQQYATFHQTKQQGRELRMHRLLIQSQPPNEHDDGAETAPGMPTIESILPPSYSRQSSGCPSYMLRQRDFCQATIRNQFFLDTILKYSDVATSQDVLNEAKIDNATMIDWVTEEQMSKVDSVLKSVARDWSREGREERGVAYDRILDALDHYLPLSSNKTHVTNDDIECDGGQEESPRIAVPGSGEFLMLR